MPIIEKSTGLLLSIGQVADRMQIPTHTIRFWTEQFKHIIITFGKGQRRYYNEFAINELIKIKDLLHNKKLTIEGVRQLIKYGNIQNNNKNPILNNDLAKNNKFNSENIAILINNIEDIENIVQDCISEL